ncbi:MAG: FAD-dependent oxidoreductase, partial [Rhodospirillales bacterium]|nr:FAD-dependent oxidoreductase [Rhodospirillales bacterium]
GRNAGGLAIQVKPAALIPYALKSWELWRTTADWLGAEVGFEVRGGLTFAFDEAEAEMLESRTKARQAAGAPIEIIGPNRAREIEPGFTGTAALASYCALDAFADSTLTGFAYRGALARAGVAIMENTAATGIDRNGDGFAVNTAGAPIRARRLVLAGGVWLVEMARWLGIDIPIRCAVPSVTVTERMPPIFRAIIGVASGRLTLKQAANGTVLIGGGWQGTGDARHGGLDVISENLIGNLRLAHHVIPGLAQARVARTWLGLEAHAPDSMPLVGPLPGIGNAFVIGCVWGGFSHGPLVGRMLADEILGREPEMPLFDPRRLFRNDPPDTG